MNVLILSDEEKARTLLKNELSGAGFIVNIDSPEAVMQLTGTIADIVVLALTSVSRDLLKQLSRIRGENPLPVVVFADEAGEATTAEVVQAGVDSYVIDGMETGRIKTIIEVAMARFRQVKFLHDEMISARNELAERKDIERAKGVLMKQRGLSEEEAYKTLRKAAMDQNKRIAEVAKSVVSLADVFG